jgi:dTDP-4-amino-4,6-dideoxygalactose transaminase
MFLELPETEKATLEVLSIPVHPNLTKRNLDRIVKIFNSTLTRVLKV